MKRLCLAFATALLGLPGSLPAQPTTAPLLVLLEGDAPSWQKWCETVHWQFLAPWGALPGKSVDEKLKAFDRTVSEAAGKPGVDAGHVYLVTQAGGTPTLFYVLSRLPDLWTAGVALGGNPRPAIDTNRIYAVNSTNVPVLWMSGAKEDQATADWLKKAGYNLEFKVVESPGPREIFEWLASKHRDRNPASVDCETGSPLFARCYWIEMTRFDPAERNDVLTSTRVPPMGSGAKLDLGAFGINRADSGPGVLVNYLPPDYSGPLKLNDRIVGIGGKSIANPAAYVGTMDQLTEAKPVVVMVERGKERTRIETQIVLPTRDEIITARVQGRRLVDTNEIQILSRAITGMRLTLPADWVPAALNWNGTDLGKADTPGCWLLDEQKAILSAKKCP